MKYSKEGKPLTLTTEQTGTPTNANDLADVILKTITQDTRNYGVYHYGNNSETTLDGFAEAILCQNGKLKEAKLAKTNHYPTFAARLDCSVMDNTKTRPKLKLDHIGWQESLKSILRKKGLIYKIFVYDRAKFI